MSLTELKYAKDEIAQLKERIAEKNQNLDAYRISNECLEKLVGRHEVVWSKAKKFIEIGIAAIEGEVCFNKDSMSMREFLDAADSYLRGE